MPKSGRCESQLWCGGVVFTDEVKRTSLVIRSHKNDPVVDVDPRLKWVVFRISGNPSRRNFSKKNGWLVFSVVFWRRCSRFSFLVCFFGYHVL